MHLNLETGETGREASEISFDARSQICISKRCNNAVQTQLQQLNDELKN